MDVGVLLLHHVTAHFLLLRCAKRVAQWVCLHNTGTTANEAIPGNNTAQLLTRLRAASTTPKATPPVVPSSVSVLAADVAAHNEPQPVLDEADGNAAGQGVQSQVAQPSMVMATSASSSLLTGVSNPLPTCIEAYAAARGMQASWGGGYWCAPLHGYWSSYYAVHAREPSNTEPAPWVKGRRRW